MKYINEIGLYCVYVPHIRKCTRPERVTDKRNSMAANHLYKHEDSFAEEKRLWVSFKKGDIRAYEKLFNLFYNDLYRYGLNLSPEQNLVRDSIHSLFVTMWDRKEYLGEVRSIKAYLLASLRRRILNEILNEKNRNSLSATHINSESLIQISIEESIIQNELADVQKQALKIALDHLPERQKEILFLKYYNGMSYEEIEEILAINYQSIRNHVYRALQKLRIYFMEKENIIGVLLSMIPFLMSVMISFNDVTTMSAIG